jgi:hypothetical protein
MSSMRERMPLILAKCSSSSSREILGGSFPSSRQPTKFLVESASPMRRSRASGGQVDMRNVGRMPGWALITSGPMAVKSFVSLRPCSTLSIVLLRVSLYAFGANFINHLLNWSTEARVSAFHKCGLSALTGICYSTA